MFMMCLVPNLPKHPANIVIDLLIDIVYSSVSGISLKFDKT